MPRFHSLLPSRRKLTEFFRAIGSRKYRPEEHYMRGPGPATQRKETLDSASAHVAAEAHEQG